jgi:hypothetical protein
MSASTRELHKNSEVARKTKAVSLGRYVTEPDAASFAINMVV